jgi:hypothetical protein
MSNFGKKIKINYENLNEFDLVLVTERSLFSGVIRYFTIPRKYRWKNRRNLATHIAIIINFNGQKILAEMLTTGLTFSSLEKYNSGKKRKPYIIDIIRLPFNPSLDLITNCKVKLAYDFRKILDYDWIGDLAFVFKKVKENPDKAFCSEYASYFWELLGMELPKDYSSMSPYDVQLLEHNQVNWIG